MQNRKKDSAKKTFDKRPPIVTVLGHVDHGKTTLLDKIRNTSLVSKEAGGITQNIGASTVVVGKRERITFIDTPGHAAFSNMRKRGVSIADIVLLVVAMDDGVKPQTLEALEYIFENKIPFLVVGTKKDLPSAKDSLVRSGLEEKGVKFEDGGGDVPLIFVSAKDGQGIDELLENLILIADIYDFRSNPKSPLKAFVFESGKDKGGPFASIVVKEGKLTQGDSLVVENTKGKARAIFDENNLRVQEVLPGFPCRIIGFSDVPTVGSRVFKDDQVNDPVLIKDKKNLVKSLEEDQLPIILKAASSGSLEAIVSGLPGKVVVIDSGVGEVTESELFVAKSSGADIYTFEVKSPSKILKLAATENVKIYNFDIVYKLFEHLEERFKKEEIKILGKAKIEKTFDYKNKKVAGCRVFEGEISKDNPLILKSGEKEIGKVKIISFRRRKVDIEKAKQGEEFGVIFVPQLEFSEGDMVLSVQK